MNTSLIQAVMKAHDADLPVSTPSSDSKLDVMTSRSQNPAVLTRAEGAAAPRGPEAAVAPAPPGRRGPLVGCADSPEPGSGCCL